jgi:hypothetical protein
VRDQATVRPGRPSTIVVIQSPFESSDAVDNDHTCTKTIFFITTLAGSIRFSGLSIGLAPSQASREQHPVPRPGIGESVRPYADRGLVTRQQWNSIIGDAVRELWLYGMAEFEYATDDAVPRILARATGRGSQVRILLLNPGSQIIEAIDRDEGHPAGTLAARITAGAPLRE